MYLDPTLLQDGAKKLTELPGVGTATSMVKKAPVVGSALTTASKALQGVHDVGKIAVGLSHGQLPTAEQCTSLLKTIPGMETVGDIADMARRGYKQAKVIFGPDDGKPKSCWLKTHGRGFGHFPPCKAPQESSLGMCYDKCHEGHGVGPVCWGSCPAKTSPCGVLCLLEGEKCTSMVYKVTKDAINTGVKAVGQDYFGAIKGALNVVGGLAYPVCATMNEIDLNDDEWYWSHDHDNGYVDHRYFDQYFDDQFLQ